MFAKMFGGPKKGGPVASQQATGQTIDAIQKLGETEELLRKRSELLEKKIAAELEKARTYAQQKNKRGALMALKTKKLYENQLEQLENNMLRIAEQTHLLENQRITVETVSALAGAAKASKTALAEMKIEKVDEVMDQIQDQADAMKQIQDAMGQPLGAAAELDESDLLEELQELEASEMDKELLAPAPVPSTRLPAAQAALPEEGMPSAPTRPAKAPAAKTPEELELEALEAEFS